MIIIGISLEEYSSLAKRMRKDRRLSYTYLTECTEGLRYIQYGNIVFYVKYREYSDLEKQFMRILGE